MEDEIAKYYEEWCAKIAASRTEEEFIAHFREHVTEHYERHNRKGKIGLEIWLIGVLNFMHIFEKKFPHITTADLLFKLCTFHKNHPGGSEPPFDLDQFIENYGGRIKQFHKNT